MNRFALTALICIAFCAACHRPIEAKPVSWGPLHAKQYPYSPSYSRLHYWAPRIFIYRAYHQRIEYRQYTPPPGAAELPYSETLPSPTPGKKDDQSPELLPPPETN